YVRLEQLPLTPNGKVDRRALPAPSPSRSRESPVLVPLQSEMERTVASVWSEVLQVEPIGSDSNFFDLGGHSLLLMKVHDRLTKLVQSNLTIVDLFRFPTVNSLATFLTQRETTSHAVAAVRTPTSSPAGRDAIAIIGMSGRFPGADSV